MSMIDDGSVSDLMISQETRSIENSSALGRTVRTADAPVRR